MNKSEYESASNTIFVFSVGSFVLIAIAFCLTFLGYALYCRMSHKSISWKPWGKGLALLLIAFAISLAVAATMHVIIPAFCLFVFGVISYFSGGDRDTVESDHYDPSEVGSIPEIGLSVRAPYVGANVGDPLCDACWDD